MNTAALSGAGVMRLFNKVGETVNKITYKMDENDSVSDLNMIKWFFLIHCVPIVFSLVVRGQSKWGREPRFASTKATLGYQGAGRPPTWIVRADRDGCQVGSDAQHMRRACWTIESAVAIGWCWGKYWKFYHSRIVCFKFFLFVLGKSRATSIRAGQLWFVYFVRNP